MTVEEWPYRLLACIGFVTIAIAGLADGEAQSAELDDHWRQRSLGLGTRYRVLLVSGLALVLEHH